MSSPGRLAFPVLVVDRHSDAATSTADYLRLVGFDAKSTTDGRDALALVSDWHPSAAVVHLRLPEMTGYELAARLCEILPHRPVLIATTGYGTDAELERAKAFGFDHFLIKPFDPRDLAGLLALHAEGRSDEDGWGA